MSGESWNVRVLVGGGVDLSFWRRSLDVHGCQASRGAGVVGKRLSQELGFGGDLGPSRPVLVAREHQPLCDAREADHGGRRPLHFLTTLAGHVFTTCPAWFFYCENYYGCVY